LEDYLKYWPSIAGVFFVALVGTLAWPSEEEEGTSEVQTLPSIKQPKQKPDPTASGAEDGKEKKKPVALQVQEFVPEVLTLETVEAVPLEGPGQRNLQAGDKDVKEALKQVEIEVYKADWCVQCQKAIQFFEHNELKFMVHDVEADWSLKDKARRLSGQTGIPVIVIDGTVTVGFSEEELSRRLSAAVEQRVLTRTQ
jgi:glutaredoxin